MELVKEVCFLKVVVEADCAPMSKIKEGKEDMSPLGHLIGALQQELKEQSYWSISYISKRVNVQAHNLGQYACDINDHIVWLEDAPNFLPQLFWMTSLFCKT